MWSQALVILQALSIEVPAVRRIGCTAAPLRTLHCATDQGGALMAWLIDGAVGGKNFVDFEPEIEGAVASGAAMVRDGEPPAERSLRFAARLATSRKSVPNMWFIASR